MIREGRRDEGLAIVLGTGGQTPNSKASGGAPVKLTGRSASAVHDGVMGGDGDGGGTGDRVLSRARWSDVASGSMGWVSEEGTSLTGSSLETWGEDEGSGRPIGAAVSTDRFFKMLFGGDLVFGGAFGVARVAWRSPVDVKIVAVPNSSSSSSSSVVMEITFPTGSAIGKGVTDGSILEGGARVSGLERDVRRNEDKNAFGRSARLDRSPALQTLFVKGEGDARGGEVEREAGDSGALFLFSNKRPVKDHLRGGFVLSDWLDNWL